MFSNFLFLINLTLTFIINQADSDESDTLIINPTNVLRQEHTIDKDGTFHLVLKLNIPISDLLDSITDKTSKTVHFVLKSIPDPKGAIFG